MEISLNQKQTGYIKKLNYLRCKKVFEYLSLTITLFLYQNNLLSEDKASLKIQEYENEIVVKIDSSKLIELTKGELMRIERELKKKINMYIFFSKMPLLKLRCHMLNNVVEFEQDKTF